MTVERRVFGDDTQMARVNVTAETMQQALAA